MELVSPYLIAIIAAWLLSHIIKYAIATGRGKRLDLTHQLFISGGMPSSHAATSIAVWMVILLRDGMQSAVFGLATLVVLVITYDAVKVRRSSGEQGEAITQLIRETKSSVKLPRAAKGHTPLEVLVGAVLGAVIGLVVFLATK
jgi:acid phosphatase family membrane protein YuiD